MYWLKQLVDLKMKEGTSMSNHLNEFHTIFSQLTAQEISFLDSVKAMLLLITLPESWDTFCIALSNFVLLEGLSSANGEGNLLTKEINRKNNDKSKGNSVLVVRGRNPNKVKKGKRTQSHSKSPSPKFESDIECYECGKKGHMKRDYPKWKVDKGKEKSFEHDEKKFLMKIGEINVVESVRYDSDANEKSCVDIFFTSTLDFVFLTAID